MADPVALVTNNLPSTPRVGEKVNLEEGSVAVEDRGLEVGEIQVREPSVNGEVDDPKLNQNEDDGEGEHESQDRNEAVREEKESDARHENHDTVEEPQNEGEAGQDDAKAPEIEVGKPFDGSDKGKEEDASYSEEESMGESGSESDSEYSSTESSDEEHTDHSSGDGEKSDEEEREGDEEDDEGEDVIVEDEDAREDHAVKRNEKNEKVEKNEWQEREDNTTKAEQQDQTNEEGDKWNPSIIPRRTTFWGHDDRWSDTAEEERRKPTNRKLWDRTTDRWEHDMYREEEQGPKTKEEKEASAQWLERGGGRGGRRRYNLQEFVTSGQRGGRAPRGRMRMDNEEFQENDRNKENRAPQQRMRNDRPDRQRRRQRREEDTEGGERPRGGFERPERDVWQDRGDNDDRRRSERRHWGDEGEGFDYELRERNERNRRRQRNYDKSEQDYEGNGRHEQNRNRTFDERRDRDRRRQDDSYNRSRKRDFDDNSERREQRGQNEGRRNDGRSNIDSQVRQPEERRREEQRDRRKEQNIRQDNRRGGFGDPQKERSDSKETKAQRNKRDVEQGVNEEQTSAPTRVVAKASPSDNPHSYSKLRGRGRGRGQTQEFKKSRKNAADFTREREEARRREAEEKQRQAQEEHFEDAEEERDEGALMEAEHGTGISNVDYSHHGEQYETEDYDQGVEQNEVAEGDTTAPGEPEGTSEGQRTNKRPDAKKTKDTSPKKAAAASSPGPTAQGAQATAKPKRYSSQRQRTAAQQIPVAVQQTMGPQMGAMYPDQAYYEQMGYQGLYVPSGTPPTHPVPLPVMQQQQQQQPQPEVMLRQEMPVPSGDQPEMPPAIPLTAAAPQPMGALQHETMIHQQLAAAVAAQHNMAAAENLQGPRAPQPAGMSPQQQQQVLAAQLQMQVQQNMPASSLGSLPQPNLVPSGMSPQSAAGFVPHPNYPGIQSFAGQPMLYNGSQFPLMNVGLNHFMAPQMYGLPMQGGTFYPPQSTAMQQQPQSQQPAVETSQQQQQNRRRPTAAIPIKSPQERN